MAAYRPIAVKLAYAAVTLGSPEPPASRLFLLAAARRLDAAHRLIQASRDRLALADHSSRSTSPDWTLILDSISDLELGTIALNRAIDSCYQVSRGKLEDPPPTPFPPFVAERRGTVKALRIAFEHVDQTAVTMRRLGPEAGLVDLPALLRDRRLGSGNDSIAIDDELQQLMVETRDYLVAAWNEYASRHRAE